MLLLHEGPAVSMEQATPTGGFRSEPLGYRSSSSDLAAGPATKPKRVVDVGCR